MRFDLIQLEALEPFLSGRWLGFSSASLLIPSVIELRCFHFIYIQERGYIENGNFVNGPSRNESVSAASASQAGASPSSTEKLMAGEMRAVVDGQVT